MAPLSFSRRDLLIGGRVVWLDVPQHPEQLWQDCSRDQGASDHYWAMWWESALATSCLLLSHTWTRPLSCLELGCGSGLTGIAALLAGHDVTFSDGADPAVRLAQRNAAANGYPDVSGLVFDWREPPVLSRFDLLLASDILYDAGLHAALFANFEAALQPGGSIWIGDPGRESTRQFLTEADCLGWRIRLTSESGRELIQPQRGRFQLIELCR